MRLLADIKVSAATMWELRLPKRGPLAPDLREFMPCDPPRQRSRTKAASDKRMRSNVNLRIRRRMKSVAPIPTPPNSGRSRADDAVVGGQVRPAEGAQCLRSAFKVGLLH
jgi:hypothetical protein